MSTTTPDKVGAKGLVYNDANKANSMGVSWACNWGQEAGVSNPSFEYVPQLWGLKNGFQDSIAGNAASAKNVLFYNEPDKTADEGGCGPMAVPDVVKDFNSYMLPLQQAGKAVSTPCVANDRSDYVDSFLGSFANGAIDIMCFHWYGPDLDGLKSTVETFKGIASKHGVKQIWIAEMAVLPAPGDLSEITSYLDGAVDRYAYNLNDLSASY